MQRIGMIFMGKKLDEIVERLLNLPDEKKEELARKASRALARRRARRST